MRRIRRKLLKKAASNFCASSSYTVFQGRNEGLILKFFVRSISQVFVGTSCEIELFGDNLDRSHYSLRLRRVTTCDVSLPQK